MAPENYMLKDTLMERTVETQLVQLNGVGERGKVTWLHARWNAYAEAGSEAPGQLHHFIDKIAAPVLDYLTDYLRRETAGADAAAGATAAWADGETLLRKLAAQPPVIRGTALIDPQQLATEATLLRAEVEALMASALEETTGEHLTAQASFLDDCFNA
jgi:hypothetical protein